MYAGLGYCARTTSTAARPARGARAADLMRFERRKDPLAQELTAPLSPLMEARVQEDISFICCVFGWLAARKVYLNSTPAAVCVGMTLQSCAQRLNIPGYVAMSELLPRALCPLLPAAAATIVMRLREIIRLCSRDLPDTCHSAGLSRSPLIIDCWNELDKTKNTTRAHHDPRVDSLA